MKTAIIGYGVVGRATHHGLLGFNQLVIILDPGVKEYAETKILNQDLVFVCIPTVNRFSIQSIVQTCRTVKKNNPDAEIVIRSTLPLYQIDSVTEVCGEWTYCPEFLRERHWQQDCQIKPVIVGTNIVNSKLIELLGDSQCVSASIKEAAALKLLVNAFNSMRVVFANHVSDLCQRNGCDFDLVIENFQHQIQKNPQSYLEVSEKLRGFGGKCLPKDLLFLIEDFENSKLNQTLFTGVSRDNLQWPITVRKDV